MCMFLRAMMIYGLYLVTTTSETAVKNQVIEQATQNIGLWTKLSEFLGSPIGGVVISIITTVITVKISYRIEKNKDEKYGRHRKLNIALRDLNNTINQTMCDPNTNPYCLRYTIDAIHQPGSQAIPCGDYDSCINRFKPICEAIDKLIMEEDNNIKPCGVSAKDWNIWQSNVHDFTRLIIEREGVGSKPNVDATHKGDWDKTVIAIQKLIEATDYAVQ